MPKPHWQQKTQTNCFETMYEGINLIDADEERRFFESERLSGFYLP